MSFTPRPSDVQFELDLAAAQAMRKVVYRTFTLGRGAPLLDTGRKRGNILLRVS